MKSLRGRSYRQTVTRMRGGVNGDWVCSRAPDDRSLVRRLVRRIAYGGRKGRRAFIRLWAIGVRPSPVHMRVRIHITGFEL